MSSDTPNLTGKVAWVTGGGTGVGAQIALSLAQAGASVVVSGRTKNALKDTVLKHSSITSFAGDVTVRNDVDQCCAHIKNHFGGLDIVVANAGHASSAPFSQVSEHDLRTLFEVNVLGVFNVWQSALPLVKAADAGRLVVIASTAGLKGYPYVSGYCAAKHAVVGLTKSVAAELSESNVTVNAVCPGYINTPMLDRTIANIVKKTGLSKNKAEAALKKTNPQGRFIEPIEVASTVLWVCHNNSGSITGQTISVSGGET
jgi:NAD(P)-dependent dehydrogenase (short-subunit alcohol dehydrogenase family)